MTGRSIRIYLVDGDASGLLTAEVMNWSGKFVVCASHDAERACASRGSVSDGCIRTLWSRPGESHQDMIYIGEGDNVFKRNHGTRQRPDKDFWTRCVAVISKDLNLTKGHVRFWKVD